MHADRSTLTHVTITCQERIRTSVVLVRSSVTVQRFSGRLKLKVKCMKLLVEVQSTMTTNYIDAAVYLCYIGNCHG